MTPISKPITLGKINLALLTCLAVLATATAAQKTGATPWAKRLKQRPAQAPQRAAPSGAPQFGDPLAGLSTDELAAFTGGRDEFEAVETVAGGLGPIFKDSSCVACHWPGPQDHRRGQRTAAHQPLRLECPAGHAAVICG